MYSVCFFRYMLGNSYCEFFSFMAFVFSGFFLFHWEAVFTSARFPLTTNVSHEILDLLLSFVGIYSAAASRWALTKFSYSPFGIRISVFSWSASNLFLIINTCLSQISLLLRRAQSKSLVVAVRVMFLRRLSRIFAVTIRGSEDTPSKVEYASQFIALFFHFFFYKDVVYLYFSVVCVRVGP